MSHDNLKNGDMSHDKLSHDKLSRDKLPLCHVNVELGAVQLETYSPVSH
jgi:hypothetical protein